MYTLQERKQKGSYFSEACYFWQILFSKDGYISHPHVPLQCYLVTTLSKNGVYLSPPLNLVGLVITLTNRQWQKSGATYQMQVAHCLWSMILQGAHENIFIYLKIRIKNGHLVLKKCLNICLYIHVSTLS